MRSQPHSAGPLCSLQALTRPQPLAKKLALFCSKMQAPLQQLITLSQPKAASDKRYELLRSKGKLSSTLAH